MNSIKKFASASSMLLVASLMYMPECLAAKSTGAVPAQDREVYRGFPTGHFAYLSSFGNGLISNHNTFFCRSDGIDFCIPFDMSKLNAEEKKYLSAAKMYGDVIIEYDEKNKQFTMSGHILVPPYFRLTTGFENGTYGKYTPRPCTLKTEESPVLLSCEMINPEEFAKNPNSKFIIHFASENNDQIYLRTYTYPTYFKDQALKNVGVIHGKILDREEEDDYIHNQYVSAKLEFTLEDRILNSTWKGLKDSKKKALKSAQIQWINDKTSKCGTPRDGMSENELINVYRCQFNYTRERSEFLVNQY